MANNGKMRGPMGGHGGKHGPKPKMNGKVLKRLLKMLFEAYPVLVPVTAVCIVISAITAALPNIFLQKVLAVITEWAPRHDWVGAKAEILPKVFLLAGFYVLSIVSITV